MTSVQPLATTVTNLVVSPAAYGCTVTCTTDATVCGQLKWGSASGTYPNVSPIESVPRTAHGTAQLLCAVGLTPSTTYHYVLQWYDGSGNALDATADATFTTLAAPTPPAPGMGFSGPMTVSGTLGATGSIAAGNGTVQSPGALWMGSGVPAAGVGANGDFYLRQDTPATANQRIYVKSAGAWVAIL